MDRIFIIWPEKRWITADQVKAWFSDAIVNGDINSELTCYTTYEKAQALDQAGLITLGPFQQTE